MLRVLFICMGNICRSPTAEGMLLKQVAEAGLSNHVEIDSAGTLDYHTGDKADRRAVAAAIARNVDITRHRARQVTAADIERYDYILAMDRKNMAYLREICPPGLEGKLRLFLEFAPGAGYDEVPDPYYGDGQGFETVLNLSDKASQGLVADLRARLERDGRPA